MRYSVTLNLPKICLCTFWSSGNYTGLAFSPPAVLSAHYERGIIAAHRRTSLSLWSNQLLFRTISVVFNVFNSHH